MNLRWTKWNNSENVLSVVHSTEHTNHKYSIISRCIYAPSMRKNATFWWKICVHQQQELVSHWLTCFIVHFHPNTFNAIDFFQILHHVFFTHSENCMILMCSTLINSHMNISHFNSDALKSKKYQDFWFVMSTINPSLEVINWKWTNNFWWKWLLWELVTWYPKLGQITILKWWLWLR